MTTGAVEHHSYKDPGGSGSYCMENSTTHHRTDYNLENRSTPTWWKRRLMPINCGETNGLTIDRSRATWLTIPL